MRVSNLLSIASRTFESTVADARKSGDAPRPVGWPAYPCPFMVARRRPVSKCFFALIHNQTLARLMEITLDPRLRLTKSRPGFHERTPLFERITAPVGLFGLVADDMSQSGLRYLARKTRLVPRPIAES